MNKSLRQLWKEWVQIREKFTEEYGEIDLEFGGYSVNATNPMYGEFIELGNKYWVEPSNIIKANLITLGHAKEELVGYSYDWDFEVPCDKLV